MVDKTNTFLTILKTLTESEIEALKIKIKEAEKGS